MKNYVLKQIYKPSVDWHYLVLEASKINVYESKVWNIYVLYTFDFHFDFHWRTKCAKKINIDSQWIKFLHFRAFSLEWTTLWTTLKRFDLYESDLAHAVFWMRIISKLSDETQIPAANILKILYFIGFRWNKPKKLKNQAPLSLYLRP
jgi:hypothetical protein